MSFTELLSRQVSNTMIDMLRDNSHRIHFGTQMKETFERLYTENQAAFEEAGVSEEDFASYTCNSAQFDDWQTRAQFQTEFALLGEADRLKTVEFTFSPRFNLKSRRLAFDSHVKSGDVIREIKM
ncbi:hypothetical protein L486_06432 [Kwoniella mangroviensis CBS 10435]|uniref:Uncharacterized protein n=1 Tax=Kwoniella mangroviensis CBS 10435 TaxID=1331196 RepID=A0A1B9IJW7_9TREE|nr:hypothetical protein L486_06432 [Kwoniella mangroviensis CBS 10435]